MDSPHAELACPTSFSGHGALRTTDGKAEVPPLDKQGTAPFPLVVPDAPADDSWVMIKSLTRKYVSHEVITYGKDIHNS